jgi:hypothetical protein
VPCVDHADALLINVDGKGVARAPVHGHRQRADLGRVQAAALKLRPVIPVPLRSDEKRERKAQPGPQRGRPQARLRDAGHDHGHDNGQHGRCQRVLVP